VKYRFMNDHRHLYSLVLMCRVLQVARAGFYDWLNKPLSDRAIENQRLVGLIRDSYVASGGVYGSNRVFGDLREAGETCGRHRVARLMRANKSRRYVATRCLTRSPAGRQSSLPIVSTENSLSTHPIKLGSRTSPISELGKVGITWLL